MKKGILIAVLLLPMLANVGQVYRFILSGSTTQVAAQGVPGSLMGKLQVEFKKLGFATHRGFDQIAMDAESLGIRPMPWSS